MKSFFDVSTPAIPNAVLEIDSGDLPLVLDGKGKWSAVRRKGILYAARNRKGKTELLHRVLMGVADSKVKVDHKNHNGLDCSRSNMRIATHAQNMRNMRSNKGSSSEYLGVSWSVKENKWVAHRQVDKKHVRLGCFDSEVDAAIAYDCAACGDPFANLNFPCPSP